MGLFDKLFGGKSKPATAVAEPAITCPHAVLVPRWDNVHDMGHEDKATRYMCESCHEIFTPAEAKELSQSIRERMDAMMPEATTSEPGTEASGT
ncbi:MAG TPA: hypothetical protein VFY10_11935 [Dehalococcoidia bacterium]|nr:hypothetical protein [Dehalococcoidia bacterium]